MLRTIRTIMVSALIGLFAGQGAAPPPLVPAAQEKPMRVFRLTATKPHIAALRACTNGDDSWPRYYECQKIHTYEKYGRCLRVELWYADDTMKLVRDEC